MNQHLHANALGSTGAVISAAGMLLLGIGANIGIYEGAARVMQETHLFFTFSFIGIIGGMIEGAIVSYIFLYAFAWVYNRIVEKKGDAVK